MNNAIFKIGIAIVIITIFVYIIKNYKNILNIIEKCKDNKIIKYTIYIIIVIIFIYCCLYFYRQTLSLKTAIDWYETSKENDLMFAEYDKKIEKENKFYKEIINQNFENPKYSEPYIPKGFSYVEGNWDNGFVIQDLNQNQYVWVPCTNKDDLNIEKLQRTNFSKQAFISKDICNNERYEEFLKSALENGGFYISRFEIGKENDTPVSKKDIEIWNNVTKDEAVKIVEKMYDNINCELVNGYAYDTTLSWIMNTNQIQTDIIDTDKQEKVYTGRKSYNNIYDFIDNTMEITSETSYSNIIIRGFPYEIAQDSKDVALQNFGYNIESFDRFSIKETENYFTITTILGFRSILYK